MKQLALINPEHVTEEESLTYHIRKAARAVIFDDKDNIALLHVTKNSHYKIPGGGIEAGEDSIIALKRECLEEAGCEITDIIELGVIVEYRRMETLKQTSYGYIAHVAGEKKQPNFTDDEKADGFKLVWLPFTQALEVFTNALPMTDEARLYMGPRDILFLHEAQNYFDRIRAKGGE
jgi:8-oxo-dGTP pyrophosphatase MutT (NUDIX family)